MQLRILLKRKPLSFSRKSYEDPSVIRNPTSKRKLYYVLVVYTRLTQEGHNILILYQCTGREKMITSVKHEGDISIWVRVLELRT